MRKLGIEHDGFTFPILNRAVLLLQNGFRHGETIHSLGIKMGFIMDIHFGNIMMDVYTKNMCFCFARQLFDEMTHKDLVSWTTLISGYVSEGNDSAAFVLFDRMRIEFEPSPVTVLVMLQVCCFSGYVIEGMQLHGYVVKNGCLIEGSLQNSILKMYTNTGRTRDAEKFFGETYRRDVVPWNILTSLYISLGDYVKVFECFDRMLAEVRPNIDSLTLFISACAKNGHLMEGKMLHCFAIKNGLYDSVLKTALLDLYAKCGDIKKLIQMFSEVQFKSSISWSAMMSGLIEVGEFDRAIELFRQMQYADLKPWVGTLRNLVILSTEMGTVKLGKSIHAYFLRNFISEYEEANTPLETSILIMYAKCGILVLAERCFDSILVKDLVTWTSMIEGYGVHGMAFEALQLFNQMVDKGIKPNSITFLGLLSACSHSGFLSEGCRLFTVMKKTYGVEPNLNHYTCIVDLLGRCGKLKDALLLTLKLGGVSDSKIWGALLAASRVFENNKIADYAGKMILELEYDNVGYHTLVSNVQAMGGKWEETEETRRGLRANDFTKKPGWSYVEANGMFNCFVSGDQLHPRSTEIFEMVKNLNKFLKLEEK